MEASVLEKKIVDLNHWDEEVALEVWRFQYENCLPYQKFCRYLNIEPNDVHHVNEIPFLPVRMFKTHKVICGNHEAELIFESSGTTGMSVSKHHVLSKDLYAHGAVKGFEMMYGPLEQYSLLALLPSYLERGNSSLVYMVETFQKLTSQSCGFYLYDFDALNKQLIQNESNKIPTILIGVTYALLDFSVAFPQNLKHTIIMETGGMKGRRAEMTRMEVHQMLQKQFHMPDIHSEYGMTELLSQAYSKGNGIFKTPPWMKILTRNPEDPFDVSQPGEQSKGAANIIDLYNLYSCSFIAVDDIASTNSDGSFEILGRLDNADVRGCNLMYI